MKYVLDTNAVSALMKGDVRLLTKLEQVSRSAVSVPEPAFAEIAYGISRLPKSKRKETLHQRFELIRAELSHAVWTDAVTDAFGRIKALLEKQGRRIEDFDAAIAAHAAADDAVLVSANVKHLDRIPGIKLEDWALA